MTANDKSEIDYLLSRLAAKDLSPIRWHEFWRELQEVAVVLDRAARDHREPEDVLHESAGASSLQNLARL